MPLDGRSRFQVNMLVRKSDTLSQLANFKDGSILPIFWFEAVSIPSTCITAVNKVICSQFSVTYLYFLNFVPMRMCGNTAKVGAGKLLRENDVRKGLKMSADL